MPVDVRAAIVVPLLCKLKLAVPSAVWTMAAGLVEALIILAIILSPEIDCAL
jgi:hypothetical protein